MKKILTLMLFSLIATQIKSSDIVKLTIPVWEGEMPEEINNLDYGEYDEKDCPPWVTLSKKQVEIEIDKKSSIDELKSKISECLNIEKQSINLAVNRGISKRVEELTYPKRIFHFVKIGEGCYTNVVGGLLRNPKISDSCVCIFKDKDPLTYAYAAVIKNDGTNIKG